MSKNALLNNRPVNIYILVDPRDSYFNPRYVGITVTDIRSRLVRHMLPSQLKKSSHKNNWIKKLLSSGLYPKVVLVDVVSSWEDACLVEIGLIASFKKRGFNLTNLTNGGDGVLGRVGELNSNWGKTGALSASYGVPSGMKGKTHSDEARKKISEAHRGKIVSDETKDKMSKSWNYDIHFTEENRKKLSEGHKRTWADPEFKDKMKSIRKSLFSESFSERNRSIVMCPHCGKVGGMGGMIKWHFNRCKLKP